MNKHGWMIGVCLLVFVAGSLYGVEPAVPRPEAGGLRVFNVRHYGAVADDKTDNTAAFSACVQAAIAAGGGRMVLPAGVYRGRIVIPCVKFSQWLALEIVGESQPDTIFGTVGAFKLSTNNTILKCLATSGAAVVSVKGGDFIGFSGIHVVVKDLEVRTSDDPGIGGLDLERACQCRIENVFVSTGVYSVQASKPTHGAAGIVTPMCSNGALTILRNVVVSGYDTGIVVNEHTDGDNINLACNLHGLRFLRAFHASRFGRVGAQRCTYPITVTGTHAFSIEQLDMEHAHPTQTDAHNAWQMTIHDINDPENRGVGELRWWVVEGGAGISQVFTRDGGAGIRARRIGAAPEECPARRQSK